MIGDAFPEVLTRARAGDERALETIYRDVAPLVIGYLRSLGVRDEDVASDVFVSMVVGIGSFQGDERKFRSWLLTIAHRRMVDDLRQRGRRRETPVDLDEPSNDVISSSDSESEALSRLRSRGLLDEIDRLTEDQRAVLMLRVLADLPVLEVAEILGKSETAVKALLRRAVASLERRISEE